ncbi:MAG: ATP-binding domain-containing protein, partial [Bdellovibrionales bacterium]|nr:ATP-binding domain-containing protein [Bdellovibrionales bacterium]
RLRDLLALFIEQSTLASEADQKVEGSAVRMMTLHASKGLEFPVVFLVGMEEGLFPSIKQWEEEADEDVEEERRLCYVGITRAREILYLTHVSMRRIWGNISYQEPARFFSEISEDLIEFRDMSRLGANSFRLGSSRWIERGHQTERDTGERVIYDEFSQSEASDSDSLVGALIEHPDYGPGRVLLVEGAGDACKVMVEFKGKDRRKFLFRYVASFLRR